MKFPSKKDIWLGIITWGCILICFGSAIAVYLTEETGVVEGVFLFIILVGLPIFLIWMWFTTYYVLEEKDLIIITGPIQKRIPLDKITSMKKTSNPLSSPALSLKRIEILYDNYNMALISPKNREQFLEIMRERCPNAKIKIK